MKKIEECAIIKKIESRFNMVFKTRVSRIVSSSIIFFSFGVIFATSCLGIIRTIDSHKGLPKFSTFNFQFSIRLRRNNYILFIFIGNWYVSTKIFNFQFSTFNFQFSISDK